MGHFGHGRLDCGDVAPDVGLIEAQAVAVDVDSLVADGRSQRGERAAQGGARALVVHFRPQ